MLGGGGARSLFIELRHSGSGPFLGLGWVGLGAIVPIVVVLGALS